MRQTGRQWKMCKMGWWMCVQMQTHAKDKHTGRQHMRKILCLLERKMLKDSWPYL